MSNLESVFQVHASTMASLQSSFAMVQESRRLLEADIARLAVQYRHSCQHRRRLLAQLQCRLATDIGPTTFYRVYLLDDRGEILSGRDLFALGDARAVEAGGDLVDEHPGARGAEIWCGRRLVFSSHPRQMAAI